MAGTGLFSSEYLVASKFINNIDISLGLGWGNMNANKINNPLYSIDDSFRTRSGYEGLGGEFSASSFFSGDAGYFAGIEYFYPSIRNLRLKLEYDATNYLNEAFIPISQKSKFNFGITYPINKNFQFKLSHVRGNEINFGFSFTGFYAERNPFFKKSDPFRGIAKERSDAIKTVVNREDRLMYLASLRYLNERDIFLQAAEINRKDKTYKIAYQQTKFISQSMGIGRAARTLDLILPDDIKNFQLTAINADMDMYTAKISRDDIRRYYDLNLPEPLLESVELSRDIDTRNTLEYKPQSRFPWLNYKIGPSVRSQIGGPDGFYFGNLKLTFHSELLFSKNLSVTSNFDIGVTDNLDNLRLASDSVLPHVRTDIVKYMKASSDYSINRIQAHYFNNPRKNLYTKISFGILEEMFSGFGGEVLYRPFEKNFAIGVEAWRVKQRDYEQLFDHLDYETTTGHLTLYYREPISRILFKLKGGKYLAKDSGFTFDFSRKFRSGVSIGAFFSLTDISKEEFGEGSFDKGFYFSLPIETFFTNYSRNMTGFGLKPLTRDGAQSLIHALPLYGVTDASSLSSIKDSWDDFYE